MADTRRAAHGDLRLHRRLVQHPPPAHLARLSQPRRLRSHRPPPRRPSGGMIHTTSCPSKRAKPSRLYDGHRHPFLSLRVQRGGTHLPGGCGTGDCLPRPRIRSHPTGECRLRAGRRIVRRTTEDVSRFRSQTNPKTKPTVDTPTPRDGGCQNGQRTHRSSLCRIWARPVLGSQAVGLPIGSSGLLAKAGRPLAVRPRLGSVRPAAWTFVASGCCTWYTRRIAAWIASRWSSDALMSSVPSMSKRRSGKGGILPRRDI